MQHCRACLPRTKLHFRHRGCACVCVCVHASLFASSVRFHPQPEIHELLIWQLLGLKEGKLEKQGWYGDPVLTFFCGPVQVVVFISWFSEMNLQSKLKVRCRRLHSYRAFLLSQTKSALAWEATKYIFVSSPDIAIEVSVNVLQLQWKMV